MKKIYLAASWRSPHHDDALKNLRMNGHQVYNFKELGDAEGPFPFDEGEGGFHWSDIDEDWKGWTPEQFRNGLEAPLARDGYSRDMRGLEWCDTLVMIHPSGRSAHLEAGWVCGYRDCANRHIKAYVGSPPQKVRSTLRAYALVPPGEVEPELMYEMFDGIACSIPQLLKMLSND